ncbi:RNA-binding protein [Ramlibacter sp. USB13]|uniref:RNA-binding protein n=1 Tax=Ramlibacter cellulosilyticus TaxID=2764187 RepID=A0A923MPW7_9BURK|nr:RNA-binding protein [Ramlibacter cellulosilyticus]MBC5783053.1 RNA-binding protein [Ramlibacter cellulosilyticus]
MKPFAIDRRMTNMRGVFYPTGHIVLMFPTEEDARHACELLRHDGVSEDDLCLARPEEFERQLIGISDDDDDMLLPSIGTESETAHHFRELAHAGHHALIIHASAKLTSSHVLELLHDSHISYGQRYRFLVIEDLVC